MNALLTFDLPKATSEQRQKFMKFLENEKWTRISETTTTWECSFKEGMSMEAAKGLVEKDVKDAKKESGVPKCEYVYLISDVKPILKTI